MRSIFLFFLLALTACATPETVLVNDRNGQIQTCGGDVSGSIFLGLAGYYFQSQKAAKCVEDVSAAGYHISRVKDYQKCNLMPDAKGCK